jgi:hypothetical protein
MLGMMAKGSGKDIFAAVINNDVAAVRAMAANKKLLAATDDVRALLTRVGLAAGLATCHAAARPWGVERRRDNAARE